MAKKQKGRDLGQIDIFDEIHDRQLTEEQRKFIEFKGKESVILSAVAGSGKTFSCVERLKNLIRRGVDPSKIIFFSFTKAATEELKSRIGNDDIKITTIHSFCYHILKDAGKWKDVTRWYDFVGWYKEQFKPPRHASTEAKEEFYANINEMYTNADVISSKIAAFKLMLAEGEKAPFPDFFREYERFQRETYARDFSDMLIEVDKLFKEDKWLKMFKGKYDYIFVDEFQDTSALQLRTLLSLNARYYYLIGDIFQSIYGYSGANAKRLVNMLAERRKTKEMTLTVNFRSDISIVDNSNTYSELAAKANSPLPGEVDYIIRTKMEELITILDNSRECAVLVRTNSVIRQLEKKLLVARYPMKYENYLTKKDLKDLKAKKSNPVLDRKVKDMRNHFSSPEELIAFIKINEDSKKFITTIHKSKGREFDDVVVVNSCAPEVLIDNGFVLPKKELKKVSFAYDAKDREAQNIHYVAVTRPKHRLFFMLWGNV
jgi:superfamily I DNA/RNA helicase